MKTEARSDSLTPARQDYLRSYISGVAGHDLPLDAIADQAGLFDSLSRGEELRNPHRDQWGNWEGSYCQAFREGKLLTPYWDVEIALQAKAYREARPELKPRPKYPDGHNFALCITHDTDNINYYPSPRSLSTAVARYLRCGPANPQAFRSLVLKAVKDMVCNRGKRLAIMDFDRFARLEDGLGFRSTFYLFAPELPHPHHYDSWYRTTDEVLFRGRRSSLKDVARTLHDGGWDIGLHGSYHSAMKAGCLKREKTSLEHALGFEVQSGRQHWLHFDISTTPGLHQEAGLTSDSTLGFNRCLGFRSSVAHPHKLWDRQNDRPYGTWQIPLNIMDGTLFYGNSLELNEDMAIDQCLEIMRRVADIGGVLTINWHPDHLNKEGWFRVYSELLKQAAQMNAWGCSAAQLVSHWASSNPQ